MPHTHIHTHTHTQNEQQQSQLCDPLNEIQRISDLLALQQALNLWLDSGIGFNSSSDDEDFLGGSGSGDNNETLWFFCGEAGKEKNSYLEQLIDRINHGDSYQQGGLREREREREREKCNIIDGTRILFSMQHATRCAPEIAHH